MKEYFIPKLLVIKRIANILLIVTITILSATAIIGYAESFNIFTLENVKTTGNEIVSSEELFKLSGFSFGDNTLDVDLKDAALRIETSPFIEKALISRELPNTFSIAVVERKPFAFIALDELYCTDMSGHLLPSRSHKSFDLPVITGIEDVNLPSHGDKIDNLFFEKALKIVKILGEGSFPLYNAISEVNLTPNGDVSLIGTKKGTRIYLGKSGYENKIERIRSLIRTVKPRGGLSRYLYVDLRFKNQVIVKERS